MLQNILNTLAPYSGYLALGVAAIITFFGLRMFGAGFITGAKDSALWIISIVFWAFPVALYLVGSFIPSLQQPASLQIPADSQGAVMFLGAIGGVWLIIEMLTTQNSESRSRLIGNVMASAIWTIVFCTNAGFERGINSFQLYEAIPAVFAALDLLTGIVAGIVAAWNKNPTQVSRGTM